MKAHTHRCKVLPTFDLSKITSDHALPGTYDRQVIRANAFQYLEIPGHRGLRPGGVKGNKGERQAERGTGQREKERNGLRVCVYFPEEKRAESWLSS